MDERRISDAHIARLEERLQAHIAADVEERKEIREAMLKLESSISGLLSAWNTANGIGTFLKWLSGMSVALAFFWALLTNHK